MHASVATIPWAWASAGPAARGLPLLCILDIAPSSPDAQSPAQSAIGYIGPDADAALAGWT
jgi:hypothetical protein